VTTATRRLRRASIAGLATVATAAAVVGGGAGTALGFGATGAVLTTTGTVTVYPGQSAQALDSISLAVTNGTWVAGDFITFELSSTSPATTEISNTAANSLRGASFTAAPTVTAVDGGGATIVNPVTVLSAGANSSVNDKFTLPLPTPPGDTGTTTFTISGLSVTLGSAVPATAIDIAATASNGTPFAGSATAGVVEGTIGTSSFTAGAPVGTTAAAATTISVPTLTAKDVLGGQFATSVVFTLGGGDVWTAIGAVAPPTGVVLGTGTFTGAVLTYPIASGTVPAGGTFTLTGAQATIGATAGVHNVTISSNGHSGAVEVAFAGLATREGGADRYATAAQLFNTTFGTGVVAASRATIAVVALGTNFPDALSATYLAATNATGVLLTDGNILPSSTQQVLTNGSITTVYLVGGTSAISQNVQNAIAALHVGSTTSNLNVIRIAGADRYATNAQVDLNGGVSATTGTTAIIATGESFPDALAAGPAIAKSKYPLILTTSATLATQALNTINALGIKSVIILGGTSAVSTAVEKSLTTDGLTILNRLAGADRTATAQQIATWETQGVVAGSYTALLPLGFVYGNGVVNEPAAVVNIANGANFPDALAAGAVLAVTGTGVTVATQHGQVLLLTANTTTLGAGIPAYLSGLGTSKHATTVNAIGLASAVNGATLSAALGSIS
jgi:putative cell wall-binding protein